MQVADSHPRKDRQSGLIFADFGRFSWVCGEKASSQLPDLAHCASKARRARLETIAPSRELDR
jgi:hypothetical protein